MHHMLNGSFCDVHGDLSMEVIWIFVLEVSGHVQLTPVVFILFIIYKHCNMHGTKLLVCYMNVTIGLCLPT